MTKKDDIIINEDLDYFIEEYEAAAAKLKEVKEYQDQMRDSILEHFSKVSPTSDYEGTEHIKTPTKDVTLTWKLTRSLNESELEDISARFQIPVEEMASRKLVWSSTKFKKLPENVQEEIDIRALQTKRATTAIKIATIEKEA